MKKYAIFFLFILLTFYSCNAPIPATTTPVPVTVQIPHNFFGILDKATQLNNQLRSTKITISVDRFNGNGSIESNFKTYIYTNRGNQFSGNYNNCKFTNIEVPSAGTYAVTVSVDTNECYDFIYGESCDFTKGRALYRGVSTTYNATSSPSTIYVTPTHSLTY